MLAWKESKDSQFPQVPKDTCEVMRYASLWFTIQPSCAQENIIFFVLYYMDLHMLVNQHPRLSPSLYEKYSSVAKFKAYFHKVYIQVCRDTNKKWHALPYMVIEHDLTVQI